MKKTFFLCVVCVETGPDGLEKKGFSASARTLFHVEGSWCGPGGG